MFLVTFRIVFRNLFRLFQSIFRVKFLSGDVLFCRRAALTFSSFLSQCSTSPFRGMDGRGGPEVAFPRRPVPENRHCNLIAGGLLLVVSTQRWFECRPEIHFPYLLYTSISPRESANRASVIVL